LPLLAYASCFLIMCHCYLISVKNFIIRLRDVHGRWTKQPEYWMATWWWALNWFDMIAWKQIPMKTHLNAWLEVDYVDLQNN